MSLLAQQCAARSLARRPERTRERTDLALGLSSNMAHRKRGFEALLLKEAGSRAAMARERSDQR